MENVNPLDLERIDLRDDAPEVRSWDPKKRILWHKISSENKDRMGDIVRIDGLKTKNFRKKPGVLYGHNYSGLDPVPVIGGNVGFKKEKPILWAGTKFLDERAVSPKLSDLVSDLIVLNNLGLVGWSIGFKALKVEKITDKEGKWIGYDFVESELLEYSNVIIPANQDAVNNAISKGIDARLVPAEDQFRILDRYHALKEIEDSEKFEEFVPSLWTPETKDPENDYEADAGIEDLAEDEDESKKVSVEVVEVNSKHLERYESGSPFKYEGPDPGEHTASVGESCLFDPAYLRRYDPENGPSEIWGKLKEATKPEDPVYLLEIRFPVDQWTIKKAGGWLDKHPIPVTEFIPAKNAKEYLAIADIVTKSAETLASGVLLLEKIGSDLIKSLVGGKN